MTDSRAVALNIFADFIEKHRPPALDEIDDESHAFVNMLILTALRHLAYLQKTIKSFISSPKSKQKPLILSSLILGATELLYMDSPDYAVINSYVGLIKSRKDKFSAGFVNALLRKINHSKTDLQKNDKSLFFSDDFRNLLKKSYSAAIISLIEKVCTKEPPLDITCIDSSSAIYSLGKTLPLGTLRLQTKGKIEKLPDYDKGCWWVQDFSSSLPIKMLDNLQNKKVLDLCAAPGGKTAQLLADKAKVISVDISEERLKTLRSNLARLNLSAQEIICADALDYLSQTSCVYDVVVLDAPCSATGTLRRHPEIAALKNSHDVANLVPLQKKLLDLASKNVAKDGILLYCTCSLCKEEGEQQIFDFISQHKDFQIADLHSKVPSELDFIVDKNGFIRVLPCHLPQDGGADGFFVAKLIRTQ